MFSFKKQKNIWNEIVREKKYRLSAFGLSPSFDWKVLLFLAFIGLVSMSAFSYSIYTNIVEISSYQIDTSKRETEIDLEKVNSVISEFDSRKEKFDSFFIKNTQAEISEEE